MLRLVLLSTLQSLFLVASQIFLKFATAKMDKFSFTYDFFKKLLVNWSLLYSGISIAIATMLWFYILKRYDFSVAYPLISISYIFGTVAAIYVFHETIPATRWIGVGLIMLGVIFISKSSV